MPTTNLELFMTETVVIYFDVLMTRIDAFDAALSIGEDPMEVLELPSVDPAIARTKEILDLDEFICHWDTKHADELRPPWHEN